MRIGEVFNPERLADGVNVPDALLRFPGLTTGAKLAYGVLTRSSNPPIRLVAAVLGLSEGKTQNYIDELQTAGFIRFDQHGQVEFLLHRTLLSGIRGGSL
jgi:hypothetical protein